MDKLSFFGLLLAMIGGALGSKRWTSPGWGCSFPFSACLYVSCRNDSGAGVLAALFVRNRGVPGRACIVSTQCGPTS